MQQAAAAASRDDNDNNIVVVAEFEKNRRETLRVYLHEYGGHELIGIRAFYRDGAELRPTKAGINIRVDLLPQLRAALDRAAAILEDAGRQGDG